MKLGEAKSAARAFSAVAGGKKDVSENSQTGEFDDFTPPDLPDIGSLKLPPKEKREVIEEKFDEYKNEKAPMIAGNVNRLIDALRVRADSIFFDAAQNTIKEMDAWFNSVMMVKPIYRKFNLFTYVGAVITYLKPDYGKRIAEMEIPQRLLILGFVEKERSNKRGPERFQAGDTNYVLAPEFFGEPKAKQLVKNLSALLFKVRNPQSVASTIEDLRRMVGDNPLTLAQLKNQVNGRMILTVPKYAVARTNTTCPGGQILIEVNDGRIYLIAVLGGIRSLGWQMIDQEIWIPSNQIFSNRLSHGTKVDFNFGHAYIFQGWLKESVISLQRELDESELEERQQARAEIELKELQAELKKRGHSVLNDAQFWLEKKGGFYLLEYSRFREGEFNLDGRRYPDLHFVVHRKLKKKGQEKQEFMSITAHPERLDEILLPFQSPIFTGSEGFQKSVLHLILATGYGWAAQNVVQVEPLISETDTPEETQSVQVSSAQTGEESPDSKLDPAPTQEEEIS